MYIKPTYSNIKEFFKQLNGLMVKITWTALHSLTSLR